MELYVIHEGWLEISTESSTSKSWLKISSKRQWKRKYIVLNKPNEESEEIYLAAYEKEDWRAHEAKKVLNLFPTFKISKPFNMKANREHVLEITTSNEKWYISSSKGKIIDLWAIQIQMQMKLSTIISGRIFSVSGVISKPLQRIGAAQQRCLLHLTKWGVTLALQDSRSILALWPLKTIRNYEYSAQCQFTIEAGRRAPMGEGVYTFHTNISQDEEIFSVLDAFVNASLQEKAQIHPNKRPENTDEEILKCYDELHKSAVGLNTVAQNANYDRIVHSTQNIPLPVREPSIHKPPDYNRLFNEQGERKSTITSDKIPNGYYDQLDRKPSCLDVQDSAFVELPTQNYDSLNKQEVSVGATGYDHINIKDRNGKLDQNFYDRINDQKSELGRSTSQRPAPISPKLFPLRDEPSVPFLADNNNVTPFTGRSPLSSSVSSCRSEKFEFRNSIYASAENPGSLEDGFISAGSFSSTTELIPSCRSNSTASDMQRNDSNASELKFNLSRNNYSASFKDKSHQDIADHFQYHVPSTLHSPQQVDEQYTNMQNGGNVYQNSNAALNEAVSES